MTQVSVVPYWVELVVAAFLVASGLLSLTGALGLLRLRDFFQRMHPATLGSTLGAWCASGACIIYFSALETGLRVHALLVPLFLSITVPITTILLARAAVFRMRAAGEDAPPPLNRAIGAMDESR